MSAENWQPIETAPEKTMILAKVARFTEPYESPIVVGRMRKPGIISTRPGWWDKPVTHWMPLPELPKP